MAELQIDIGFDGADSKGPGNGKTYRAQHLDQNQAAKLLDEMRKTAERIVDTNPAIKRVFEQRDFPERKKQIGSVCQLLSTGLNEAQLVMVLQASAASPQKTAEAVRIFCEDLGRDQFTPDQKFEMVLPVDKTVLFENSQVLASIARTLKGRNDLSSFTEIVSIVCDRFYPADLSDVRLMLERGLTVDQIRNLPRQLPVVNDIIPMDSALSLLKTGRSVTQALSLLNSIAGVAKEKTIRILPHLRELAGRWTDEAILGMVRFCAENMGNGFNMRIVAALSAVRASPDEIKSLIRGMGRLPCEEAFDLALYLRFNGIQPQEIRDYLGKFPPQEVTLMPDDFHPESIKDPRWRGKIEYDEKSSAINLYSALTPEDALELQKIIGREFVTKEVDELVASQRDLFRCTREILQKPSSLPFDQRMNICLEAVRRSEITNAADSMNAGNTETNDRFLTFLQECFRAGLTVDPCGIANTCVKAPLSAAQFRGLATLIRSSGSEMVVSDVLPRLVKGGLDVDLSAFLSVMIAGSELPENRLTSVISTVFDLKNGHFGPEKLIEYVHSSVHSPHLPYGKTSLAMKWVESLRAVGFTNEEVFRICTASQDYLYTVNLTVSRLRNEKLLDEKQIRESVLIAEKAGGKYWPQMIPLLPEFIMDNGFSPEKLESFVKNLVSVIENRNLTYDLMRYPYIIIRELLREKADPDYKKHASVALIVFNQSDWNAAFATAERSYWRSIVDAGFKVELFEAKTDVELSRRVAEVGQGKGKINFMLLGGHGGQTSLGLGGQGSSGTLDTMDGLMIAAWKPHLADQVQIGLDACLNGLTSKGVRSNAEVITEALEGKHARLFATPIESSLDDIIFGGTGKVEAMVFQDKYGVALDAVCFVGK